MERKPDPQQVQVITVQPVAAKIQNSKRRMAMLLFFMTLWPWFWVSFGLFGARDFRVTIVLYEILCCALPLFLLRGEHARLWPLNIGLRWIFLAVLAANIMFLTIFKQTHGMTLNWAIFQPHIQAIKMSANLQFWGYGVYLVLFNPLFEEVFWRGTVYKEWRTLIGPWRANVLSSFFFGAWHWIVLQYFCKPEYAITSALLVMIGGVIFAYAYEKTGSLGASILMHGWGADLPLLFIVHTAMLYSTSLAH